MKKILLFVSVFIFTLMLYTAQPTYALDLDSSMNFSDKKIAFLGDSLTAGSSLDEEYRWPNLVANDLGLQSFVNLGVNGSPISDDAGRTYSFVDRVTQVPDDSDYVFIMGGANDHALDVSLTDFQTDLEYVISYIRTNIPEAQIILMTYFDYGATATNTLTLTLSDYYDVIRTVSSDKYDGSNVTGHVQLLDLHNLAGVTTEEASLYTYDGLHPSIQGSRIIANMVVSYLAGTNLFTGEETINGWVNTDGTFNLSGTLDDFAISDAIEVTPGKSYVMYANAGLYTGTSPYVLSSGGAYYEADGTFIEAILSVNNLYKTTTAPANAAYVRLNTLDANKDAVFFRELINKFTVEFVTRGGTQIDTLLAENEVIVEPDSPEKTGDTFVGWYTDLNFTTEFDFTDEIDDNITIYAKWESDDVVASTVTITTPTETPSLFGLNWYWYALGAVALYYVFGTKDGKKLRKKIGLK